MKNILIGQPQPSNEKSPYFELIRKHKVNITFQPFISIEEISTHDFLNQKIKIEKFKSIIFVNKNSINHFFRICKDLKITLPPTFLYFCSNETTALYLKNFIDYKKRKVFFGTDSSYSNLFESILKYKKETPLLYPCALNKDSELIEWLDKGKIAYTPAEMYKIVYENLKDIFVDTKYHIICFLTPASVESFCSNFPNFKQNNTVFFAFGHKTAETLIKKSFKVTIKLPNEITSSLSTSLDSFLSKQG